MYILTSSDNNYIQHLGVMLVSLLENCLKTKPKEIAVINDNIDERNVDRLKTSLRKYGVPIRFIKFENKEFAHLSPKNNKTLAAFHRIFLKEFYSDHIEKVIYLDCDIVIRKDISDLFNIDISDYVIGATQNDGLSYQTLLGMPENSLFFNSGVLLINLRRWREYNVQKKLIDFIKSHFDIMLRNDQDALNAVLFNNWFALSPEWNAHLYFFTSPHLCRYDQKQLKMILNDPALVHFTTQNKPWHYNGAHPYKQEYYKYLKLTAWKDYKPVDKTLLNISKKNSAIFLSFLYKHYKGLKKVIKRSFLNIYV